MRRNAKICFKVHDNEPLIFHKNDNSVKISSQDQTQNMELKLSGFRGP